MNTLWQMVSGNPFFTVALPIVIALFVGGWWQNKRIDDLRNDNTTLRNDMNRGFDRIDKRLEKIEAKLESHSERIARPLFHRRAVRLHSDG